MSGALSAVVVPLAAEHAEQVLAIYQAGIEEGNATFETVAPTWEAFDAAKMPEHRFSALDERGKVLGWVAASRVSDRCAYAGVVEHSVYVHPEARGRGVASALLKGLINSTEAAGIWTVQSGIFPENAASLAVHRRAASVCWARVSASASSTTVGATSFSSSDAACSSTDRTTSRAQLWRASLTEEMSRITARAGTSTRSEKTPTSSTPSSAPAIEPAAITAAKRRLAPRTAKLPSRL